METNREHTAKRAGEKGNALIYVLIAIVLFAALSLTLGRETGTDEAGDLGDAKAEMYATQMISYAAQAKSSLDQMIFSGSSIDSLDFTRPSQAGFNNAPTINKVYHPDGGGLSTGTIAEEAAQSAIADPTPGWYLGRFNNVEWTKTSATDVILVAFQIRKKICEKINEKVTGTANIPLFDGPIRVAMIDDNFYSGAANADLTTDPAIGSSLCPECHEVSSLCVKDGTDDTYAFYTIVADR